jgi:hypothetical protein
VFSEFFEGRLDDLVVQLQYVSTMRTKKLEGDSIDVDSKKSCSSGDALIG